MQSSSQWRTLSVGTVLTFRVPASARERGGKPVDSLVGVLDGGGFEITYDYGPFSERIETYRDHENYRVADRRIGSRAARTASFLDAESYPTLPFARLLRVEDGAKALTLRVSCRTADLCAVADAIFDSVAFTDSR